MRFPPPWIFVGLLAPLVGCATRSLPACPPAASVLAPEAPVPSVTTAFETDAAPAGGAPAGDGHLHHHHGGHHAH